MLSGLSLLSHHLESMMMAAEEETVAAAGVVCGRGRGQHAPVADDERGRTPVRHTTIRKDPVHTCGALFLPPLYSCHVMYDLREK